MKDEYISISEFAKKAGVSHQAIYKRLDKDLQPWLQVANSKKLINIKALELFEVKESATDSTEVATIKLLQKTVEMLEKELSVKNDQIKDQAKQITELSDRLKESHLLIDHQQQLAVAGMLTATSEPEKPDPDEETTQELTGTPPQYNHVEIDQPRKWWQFRKKRTD